MSRPDGTRTSLRPALAAAALALCAAAPALATTPPKQVVRANLAPTAQAKSGSGTFTASGAPGATVVMRWQLSVSGLGGQVRKATMQIPGQRKIVFALCEPCRARTHGQTLLLGAMWTRLRAGGGIVVVTTKAHPAGALRGLVKRG